MQRDDGRPQTAACLGPDLVAGAESSEVSSVRTSLATLTSGPNVCKLKALRPRPEDAATRADHRLARAAERRSRSPETADRRRLDATPVNETEYDSTRVIHGRAPMAKTVTLRLDDRVYDELREAAKAENRPLSNLIETAALSRVREQQFVDDAEMAEILGNQRLLARLRAGSREARKRKGRFVV